MGNLLNEGNNKAVKMALGDMNATIMNNEGCEDICGTVFRQTGTSIEQ